MDAKFFYPLLMLLLIWSTFVQAQDEKVADSYTRSSITTLFTTYNSSPFEKKIKESAPKVNNGDKYFINKIATTTIPFPSSMLYNDTAFVKRKELLSGFMQTEKIGNQIVSKSFNRSENGMFNLEVLNNRAEYNATDQEVLIAQASKRGEALIKDYGIKLVDNSYVQILDLYNMEQFDKDGTYGYRAKLGIYIYKLDFNTEKINEFYGYWPYSSDDQEILTQKRDAFDNMEVALTSFYTKTSISLSSTDSKDNKNRKSKVQLFDELLQSAYDRAIFQMAKDIECFRVKANVADLHPIRAKIGKKEGAMTDHRYFVYEYIYNQKTETVEPSRKAVLRIHKQVADNRKKATGTTENMTEFYQIYGGTVQEGMLLQEKKDFGISAITGTEVGSMGGFYLQGMYRAGGYIGVPALFVVGTLGFNTKEYPTLYQEEGVFFTRWDVGLAKGWQMARIFEIMALVAYGGESCSIETSSGGTLDIETEYLKFGGQLGIQITHSVQLFGVMNLYAPGKVLDSESGNAYTDLGNWSDLFDGRSGPTVGVGLRFDF